MGMGELNFLDFFFSSAATDFASSPYSQFIVAIISLAVAASLAEMCSAYPHAAGKSTSNPD
jgi:amino acid transporter